jgi:ABC-2 type transport system permease protein/capsular polysaccharide transport system permease protein
MDAGMYNPEVKLAQAWRVERRVIWALMLREILTRYGRHNIGFLWLFVEPMIFTLGVATLWTALKAVHGSNLPIIAFAITGYSSVLLWRNMPSRCIGALEPNLSLLYHRNVRPIDVYLARLLLEAAGATMSFVMLTLFFHFIGWLDFPENVLQVVFGWFMIAWFGIALAILLGALSENSEAVEKLWHPAAYLLFPLSGAAFLVNALPTAAQQLVLYLPMVNGVEFVREGFFGSKMIAHYDMGYMALANTALTVLGLAQVRKVSRTVIPE